MRNEHTPRGRYTRRLFLSAGLALALYAWWEQPGRGVRTPPSPPPLLDLAEPSANASLPGRAARADLAARFAAEDRLLSSVPPPPPPGDAWPLLGPRLQPAMPAARNGTLVLYVYHHTRGPEHAARAALFVRAALQDGDGVAARLLVPRGTRHLLAPRLAPLPRNASWVELPEGACQASTWGVLGAALPLLASDLAASRYVVVVDSGTAGPFLPAHLRAHLHWTEPLLARLSERVRMVGPAISCEGTPRGGDVAGDWRRQPHLPAHAWATDAQGWALLSRPQAGVMACHADPWDVRWHSDLGAAAALFDAGHTIDCLMPRYQGVDWRDERNWACNDRSEGGAGGGWGVTEGREKVTAGKARLAASKRWLVWLWSRWSHCSWEGVYCQRARAPFSRAWEPGVCHRWLTAPPHSPLPAPGCRQTASGRMTGSP